MTAILSQEALDAGAVGIKRVNQGPGDDAADKIVTNMKAAGYDVHESDLISIDLDDTLRGAGELNRR